MNNERAGLCIVADGLGGLEDGALAAYLVTRDVAKVDLEKGDRRLLRSDGWSGMLGKPGIASLVAEGELGKTAVELVRAANAAGGFDNITAGK